MKLLPKFRRKSARAIIIKDGKLLTFLRRRHSRKTGEWIEYYSIPGGGIDRGETPENAVKRELMEEMGVAIEIKYQVAHIVSKHHEHFVFEAAITHGIPTFQLDSEESMHSGDNNQFHATWVPIDELNKENLRYYCEYLDLIQMLAHGKKPNEILEVYTD